MASHKSSAPLNKRRITFELDPGTFTTFQALCESEHRNMTQQLRLLIDDANVEYLAGLERASR